MYSGFVLGLIATEEQHLALRTLSRSLLFVRIIIDSGARDLLLCCAYSAYHFTYFSRLPYDCYFSRFFLPKAIFLPFRSPLLYYN